MSIAVMQPYFFPYLGYFQLIQAVDTFVFYDDVNFIKQGYINSNAVIVNNRNYKFTVPLTKMSSHKAIKDTFVNGHLYFSWKKKFLKTIWQEYNKAICFEAVYELIKRVLDHDEVTTIADLTIFSIEECATYLEIPVQFKISSKDYSETHGLSREKRLQAICFKEQSKKYINPSGGKTLYTKENFSINNIELWFIKNNLAVYPQVNRKGGFISGLSIIDVLMNNDVTSLRKMLLDYNLD